jgi:predicted small lipoprotein YifL
VSRPENFSGQWIVKAYRIQEESARGDSNLNKKGFITRFKYALFLAAFALFLAGCGEKPPSPSDASHTPEQQATIGNPAPADFLDNPDADIFYFGGVVYINAEHLDWVQPREYTKTELLGKITKRTFDPDEFSDGAASRLPVGTPVYRTDTGIFVAVVGGKDIRYIKMVEG